MKPIISDINFNMGIYEEYDDFLFSFWIIQKKEAYFVRN